MRITITGQTPSQKNSKQIFTNRRTGKPFITSNNRVKDWQTSAAWQLKAAGIAFTGHVSISYIFHVKDNRRRDLDNMIATINDALVAAGVIQDDSWQKLSINGATALYDKADPRAELFLELVP